MHDRLPPPADARSGHYDTRRRDGQSLRRSAEARSRNRPSHPRNRRAHRLRIVRLRIAAPPAERSDRPLSHPGRRYPRSGHREDAARPGIQAQRLPACHERIFGRLAHAHRAGETAAAPALDFPAGRADQPPGHRVDPVARGLPEKLQWRGVAHLARPGLSG